MSATHSQQFDIAHLHETIQSLQIQISEISKRLSQVEETTDTSSSTFKRSKNGNATFLGTKYQKPEVMLDTAQTSRHGRFLGNDYNLIDAKVTMKSDGTKRTFLGRKFSGQVLDR